MAKRMLSWNPKRNGDIYCSPACGFKCKWADYQKAKQAAKDLAKRMGKGWKTRVWENMGWHYCVYALDGKWFIYSHTYGRKTDYSAGFNERGRMGASDRWVHADTPEEALKEAWKWIQKQRALFDNIDPPGL